MALNHQQVDLHYKVYDLIIINIIGIKCIHVGDFQNSVTNADFSINHDQWLSFATNYFKVMTNECFTLSLIPTV